MTNHLSVSVRSRAASTPRPGRQTSVPSLENGDHLTGPGFERRYDAMPDLKKAELLEGRVYIPVGQIA